MVVALAVLLLIAALANWITKRVIIRIVQKFLSQSVFSADREQIGNIIRRLSNVVPALVLQVGIVTIPHLAPMAVTVIRNVTTAFMILTVAIAINGLLTLINTVYQRRPDAASKPIKGYVQVAKLVVYAACMILIVAALMERSPILLLSGLGAMAAVLMLVFKDTILSLVASVQISSGDMVRVGDWIEMPQLNADGDVVDIALHTVKVQNWDKTITTIPTYRLISESFKNWRGMSESGGRRIKRGLMIDQSSVRFLDGGEIQAFRRFALIDSYLEDKLKDIEDWNKLRGYTKEVVNARRLTNLGTFRAYMLAYLKDRADITKDMTLLVRQLAPTPHGMPLEVYCFTATTAWAEYERIQGDIFDHFIAIMPSFGLRLYQQPSGTDFQLLGQRHAMAEISSSVA